MPTSIEVRADRVHRPVAVLVADIATVTLCQQFRVKAGIFRPRFRMRAHPNEWGFGFGHARSLRRHHIRPDARTDGVIR